MPISQAGDEIVGTGTITLGKMTERLRALGNEEKDKLNLDLVLLDNDLYRLDLVEKRQMSFGNYNRSNLEPKAWILEPLPAN